MGVKCEDMSPKFPPAGNNSCILIVDTDMRTRVQKWGNSLAVRVPQPFAKESGLAENSPVDVSLRNGKLVIAPVREPEYTLDELVAKISKKNLHSEVSTGSRRGNEAW